jgi:retron-type reverse transcriptase
MCAGRNNKFLALSKPQDKVTNYLKADENIQAFRNQLRRYNLKLRNIIGDGNCLFRSCKLIFVEFF